MDASYEPEPPVVRWRAPDGARYVACALFSCAPEIAPRTFDGEVIDLITNFDTCTALFKVSSADEGVFHLDADNAFGGFSPQRCVPGETRPRLYSELVVGCWAYDTYQLVAATDLIAVPPNIVGLPMLPQGHSCAADGDACYDAVTDTFGVCLDTTCTARCRTAADCGVWALRTGAAQPGDSCAWTCRSLPASNLGACANFDP